MNNQLKQNTSHRIVISATVFLSFFPIVAFAQEEGISGLISAAQTLINQLIPLTASLTLLAFFWGLAKYIFNAGNEEAQEQGKRVMVGGIVALFLIASIGGIVGFLVEAFGFESGASIDPPTINLDVDNSFDTAEMVYNKGDGIG